MTNPVVVTELGPVREYFETMGGQSIILTTPRSVLVGRDSSNQNVDRIWSLFLLMDIGLSASTWQQ